MIDATAADCGRLASSLSPSTSAYLPARHARPVCTRVRVRLLRGRVRRLGR
jgi:hypothetical protein